MVFSNYIPKDKTSKNLLGVINKGNTAARTYLRSDVAAIAEAPINASYTSRRYSNPLI